MTYERAMQIHDRAWADYMKSFRRVRAKRGRGSFAAQQTFIENSERVARAQGYVIDGLFSLPNLP